MATTHASILIHDFYIYPLNNYLFHYLYQFQHELKLMFLNNLVDASFMSLFLYHFIFLLLCSLTLLDTIHLTHEAHMPLLELLFVLHLLFQFFSIIHMFSLLHLSHAQFFKSQIFTTVFTFMNHSTFYQHYQLPFH